MPDLNQIFWGPLLRPWTTRLKPLVCYFISVCVWGIYNSINLIFIWKHMNQFYIQFTIPFNRSTFWRGLFAAQPLVATNHVSSVRTTTVRARCSVVCVRIFFLRVNNELPALRVVVKNAAKRRRTMRRRRELFICRRCAVQNWQASPVCERACVRAYVLHMYVYAHSQCAHWTCYNINKNNCCSWIIGGDLLLVVFCLFSTRMVGQSTSTEVVFQ